MKSISMTKIKFKIQKLTS